MAQFEEQNPLDYRAGGDTVDDFAQKYMKEIARIYQFLNNLREHNSNGPNQVEPQPYMFKVTDNKLYIRNSSNNAWLYLFDITYRMGMSDNPDAVILTSDDVTTTAEALKLVKTNADGDIDADITGNAYKFGNKTADQYVTVDDVSDAGAALKIVKTDSDGVAHVSISGSAAQLNGKAASYYLNEDDLATVPSGAAVTTDANKLVKTNANGVLPVNIAGNAAKIAGIVNEINNLQDGQVLTYRVASNSWRNEDKGVVGAGKALAVYDDDTLLAEYSGDAPISINLAKHNRIASTAYTVGTCANHDTLPAGWYLECTTAGTSDSSDLTITSPTVGGTVTDGTVVWTIRNAASTQDISTLNSRINLVNSIAARDTAVSLRDTAMLEGIPAGYFLECTTGGTTGTTSPVITPPVAEGDTISDGTVVWTVRKTNSIFNTLQMGVFNHKETFTSSGSFTAPVTGVYRITAKGGGGGGGGSRYVGGNCITGSGGGEGGTIIRYLQMAQGDTLSYVIGAGGTRGESGNGSNPAVDALATDGGNTTFTYGGTTYTAGGGEGGTLANRGGNGGSGDIVGCSGGSSIYNSTPSLRTPGTSGGGAGGGGRTTNSGVNGGGGAGAEVLEGADTGYHGYPGGDGYLWVEYCDV